MQFKLYNTQNDNHLHYNIVSYINPSKPYLTIHTTYIQMHQVNTTANKVDHTTQEQFKIRIIQYKQLAI